MSDNQPPHVPLSVLRPRQPLIVSAVVLLLDVRRATLFKLSVFKLLSVQTPKRGTAR